MKRGPRLSDPPVDGDYLTDGNSLYEVTGDQDSEGYFYLTDCKGNHDPRSPAQPMKISPHELWEGFWLVHPEG